MCLRYTGKKMSISVGKHALMWKLFCQLSLSTFVYFALRVKKRCQILGAWDINHFISDIRNGTEALIFVCVHVIFAQPFMQIVEIWLLQGLLSLR